MATRNFNIPAFNDVPDVEKWVLAIDDCVERYRARLHAEAQPKACICIVPDFIRQSNKKAFTPQVVSLGPFHNGAEALKPGEEHKRRALITFLERSSKPLWFFMSEVRKVAPELQRYYHNLEDKWLDVDKFTQLMILDGCFVLEITRPSTYPCPVLRVPYIQRDMLVLENQIPLKLLKVLLEVQDLKQVDDKYVNDRILAFFHKNSEVVKVDDLAMHPLDLYHKSMIQGAEVQDSKKFEMIGSATRLREAGISFKRSNGPISLSNISFQKGVLYLPLLKVDDSTEFQLLNMMTFEQIHHGSAGVVTGYVSFMDDLIDTPKDVNLLENEGIIENMYGSSESVAKLFNEIGKDRIMIPGWKHEKVRSLVADHCKKKWNKYIALLKHDYFRSPWSFISLIGVTLVILLTATQTAYIILQYYHPH